MKSSSKNNWFYGVDSIRFILAFVVMLSHFDNVYANALKLSSHALARYAGYFVANAFDGTSAVIAFFIISGFVIHYPNKNGIPNLMEFWIRRFLRILIPLVVILFAGQWFDHPESTVVWSLYCELIYYAIYPFLGKLGISWKKMFLITYGIAAVLIVTLCYHDIFAFFLQTNDHYHGYYWQLNWYLTWLIGLPCWLLGVVIAEEIDGLTHVTKVTVILYRVLVYVVSCFCCIAKFHLHLSYIITMNFFALLIYKWIQTEIVWFKQKKPLAMLEKMGKFSYSLYLCHPLLNVILGTFFIYNTLTYPLFIILTIVLAYVFYRLVEKPGHSLARMITRRYRPANI